MTAMNKEKQQVNPYPIRLTKELREKLEATARQAGRSLNSEMILRLEASLQEEEATPADSQSLTADDVRRLALEVVRKELTKAGK